MILLVIAAVLGISSVIGLFIHFDRCNEEARSANLGAGCATLPAATNVGSNASPSNTDPASVGRSAASNQQEVVYGAFARAQALTAGYPRWPLVTRWPTTPESEESLHLDACTLPGDHEGACDA